MTGSPIRMTMGSITFDAVDGYLLKLVAEIGRGKASRLPYGGLWPKVLMGFVKIMSCLICMALKLLNALPAMASPCLGFACLRPVFSVE